MANFHSRSKSLPSSPHPMINDAEDHLRRLNASLATSTSSPTSICANLVSLGNLHERINNLIQSPSFQQTIFHKHGKSWIDELLEGSLSLVDLCEFSRDILYLTNESVQELKSSMRRNRGETSTINDINTYSASRKNVVIKVNKYIKNLKTVNQNSTSHQEKESDLNSIARILKEAEVLDFTVLKSGLFLVSGEKESSKQKKLSFISMFTQTSRVHSNVEQEISVQSFCSLNIEKSRKHIDDTMVQNMLKQLKASEMCIKELEQGLEALFRSLVKTRVSLLNALSH